MPEGLFESEFFGHIKEAFTGALKDQPGRFELAGGGTEPAVNGGLLKRDDLKRRQRETIINALKRASGRGSGPGAAAELPGMKPSTLASRICSLGISRRTLG